jgi:flagellar hook-associated protein 3 FlgL
MLQSARDGAYNVNNTLSNAQIKASAVTLTDASLVTGSSYAISDVIETPGSTAGTSNVSYNLTETLADGTTQPSVFVTGPDYPTSSTTPITLPGLSLRVSGTWNAGDSLVITPNASVFSVLDNAIRDIKNAPNQAMASLAVTQALNNIDIGMNRIGSARGQAGELLNRADRISGNQDKRSIQMEADRSRAEDLDMVKGISDFQNQQTGYQAALQTYAQVQKLSLFDFIR